MSYYLKYRPQQTKDLDIGAVRDFYAGILKSGKFSHAYLFSGPRGTGKTSSARILAKLLNCEENTESVRNGKPLVEPCGICDTCKRIVAGNSLAVIEMDAASNRGIDEIRALRERIALAPAEGSFVVYIIDEVHMLTTEAFNALLKTLEEPPAHAIFALCTTEYHKLPQTVVSRCTQVLYPKATIDEVRRSLDKAIKGENLKISDASLTLLTEAVDGSFRDGMKMLEQLAAGDVDISDEAVQELVRRTTQYDAVPFVGALWKKQVDEAMKILVSAEEMGVDFATFAKRVLDELRAKLLAAVNQNSREVSDWVGLVELFAKAALEVKTAYIAQLPMEIAAAQWCLGVGRGETGVGSQQGESKLQSQKTPIKSNTSAQKTTPQLKNAPSHVVPGQTVQVNNPVVESKPGMKKEYAEGDVLVEEVDRLWGEILAGVKPLNHSLEALLRSARPASANGSEVVIEVFYKFHKDRLEEERYRDAIEEVMSNLLQKKIRLQFILGDSKNKIVPKKSPVSTKENGEGDLVKAAEEIFG